MKPQFTSGPWSSGLAIPLVVFLMTAAFVFVFGPGGSATSTLQRDTPRSPADIYRQSVQGVVKIEALGSGPGQPTAVPGTAGTGFVVDGDGTILTNAHVVTVAGRAVATVKVTCTRRALSDRCVEGVVVGVDDSMDVAVVKVDPRGLGLRPLPLGDSTSLEVGNPVFAIGNPLDYDFSMRSGIVSALHRVLLGPNDAVIPEGIQTDAAINEGDSGGPLIDGAGRVIGINEQIATAEGGDMGNIGLAFALPIEAALDVLHQLRTKGKVEQPWLGIEGLTVSPALVQLLGLEVDAGVLLVAVAPGGPTAAAGLRGGKRAVALPGRVIYAGGDIVTELDGQAITGMSDVVKYVQAKESGERVSLTYLRDGKTAQADVTLGVRPDDL